MRIWYLICLSFLVYCINLLINESWNVIFYTKLKDGDLLKNHKFSSCISFNYLLEKDFNLNNSKIEIQNLFTELINQTFIHLNKNLMNLKIENDTILPNLEFIDDLRKTIDNKDYYINNYHFCFIHQVKLFYSLRFLIYLKQFIFRTDPYLFSSKSLFSRYVFLITIIDKESPISNCINFDKNNPNQKYSRFLALNNCLKKRNRSAKYYYNSNETGIIDLKKSNELITNDEEINCFNNKKLKWYDCESSFLIERSVMDKNYNQFTWKIIEAEFIIDKFDLICNIIGLICLLCKISMYQMMTKLINYLKLKFNLSESRLKKSNLIILFFNLISILIICIRIILDHNEKSLSPKVVEITKFEIDYESFFLVLCVPIERIIENKIEFNSLENDKLDDLSDDDPFDQYENKNFSLKELIEKTNTNLSNAIEGIYFDFNGEIESINYSLISSKILFYYTNYNQYRCFQIKINLIQKRYEKLLFVSKIKIKFNLAFYVTYFTIIPETSKLSNRFFQFKNGCSIRIQKITKQSIGSKCLDYSKSNLNCHNKQECVDRCIFNGYKKKYSAINSLYLIDIDYIKNESDFNRSVIKISDNQLIVEKCENKFKDDCIDIYYKCLNGVNSKFKDEFILDLNFEKVIEEETIVTSFYKLLIDLANIGSIFIGFGFYKLIFMIINLLKLKYRKKYFNYFLLIIGYLFCLFGFLIHFYFILSKNLNGQLAYSQYFASLNSYKQPEIFFCFDLTEKSIDINYAQTGSHLFQNLAPDLVFESIMYRDRTKSLKISGYDFKNGSYFKFNNYLLFDKRCLGVQLNQNFKEYDSFYVDNFDSFSIFFNYSFLKNLKKIIYFSGIESKKQFSKLVEFKINSDRNFLIIDLRFKFYEIICSDKFNLIKNPLLIFKSNYLNDVTDYVNKLINKFQTKFNYSTKKIILNSKYFNLTINDQLFSQFYSKLSLDESDDQKYSNLNYERTFILNDIEHSKKSLRKGGLRLNFYSVFYKKILKISNENNYPTLILELLNLISIWFDLNLLDFYICLIKIKYLIVKIYLLLHKIKRQILVNVIIQQNDNKVNLNI